MDLSDSGLSPTTVGKGTLAHTHHQTQLIKCLCDTVHVLRALLCLCDKRLLADSETQNGISFYF